METLIDIPRLPGFLGAEAAQSEAGVGSVPESSGSEERAGVSAGERGRPGTRNSTPQHTTLQHYTATHYTTVNDYTNYVLNCVLMCKSI